MSMFWPDTETFFGASLSTFSFSTFIQFLRLFYRDILQEIHFSFGDTFGFDEFLEEITGATILTCLIGIDEEFYVEQQELLCFYCVIVFSSVTRSFFA